MIEQDTKTHTIPTHLLPWIMLSWRHTHNTTNKIPQNINTCEKGLARVDINSRKRTRSCRYFGEFQPVMLFRVPFLLYPKLGDFFAGIGHGRSHLGQKILWCTDLHSHTHTHTHTGINCQLPKFAGWIVWSLGGDNGGNVVWTWCHKLAQLGTCPSKHNSFDFCRFLRYHFSPIARNEK